MFLPTGSSGLNSILEKRHLNTKLVIVVINIISEQRLFLTIQNKNKLMQRINYFTHFTKGIPTI